MNLCKSRESLLWRLCLNDLRPVNLKVAFYFFWRILFLLALFFSFGCKIFLFRSKWFSLILAILKEKNAPQKKDFAPKRKNVHSFFLAHFFSFGSKIFLFGREFFLSKWSKSKRKILHQKERKSAERNKMRQKKNFAFID